jgi:hypothetical protein
MNVFFSKEQYLTLVKSIFIGNEVIVKHPDESLQSDYFNLESYILSHTKEFGLEGEVMVKMGESLSFSEKIEKEIVGIVDNYIDYIFVTRLFSLLAQRDFQEKYSKEELAKMPDPEGSRILKEIIQKYYDEFKENQFKNLRLVKDA